MISDFESWLSGTMGGPSSCRSCGCQIEHFGVCDQCAEKFERQRCEASRADAYASIPSFLRWASFDAEELPRRVNGSGAVAAARTAADLLCDRRIPGIVLAGPAGTGKSSLSCAIFRAVVPTPLGYSARWQCAIRLGRSRSDSGLGTVPHEVDASRRASCLVVDDLGSEPKNGIETIREVVHERYNAHRPTVYTTWMTPAEIADRYGEGTSRRITEGCPVVNVGAS